MTRSFTLLLADQSPTIRRLVELTFADEPIAMVAVGGGEAALEEITAHPPDIVLADATLSAPDGYEVASFVKRTPALAHIPVILLTGAFQPIDPARAAEAGCDAVLVKPLDPPELEWKVKHLLRDPATDAAADRSLADRFDAVDAALGKPSAEESDEAGSGQVDFNSPEDEARCANENGRLSVNDYFDEIDEECRQPELRALKRAFRAFLEASRSQRPGRDEL